MNIAITGVDGYEGWPLAQYLATQGHSVRGVDSLERRAWVDECSAGSIIPIGPFERRAELGGPKIAAGNITAPGVLEELFAEADAVVHLAEQPSAPYSMRGIESACYTAHNNFVGTMRVLWAMREVCPGAHLVYVSTMGEYGTPPTRIPEGVFPECTGWGRYLANENLSGASFPRLPGSVYHISKVASGAAVTNLARMWCLRATVLYQGVVAGVRHPEWDHSAVTQTRLDVDEAFGTVFHRFLAQAAIGIPLSVYGSGNQRRGYITLTDVVQSIESILVARAHDEKGVVHANQFCEIASVLDLVTFTEEIAKAHAIETQVNHYPNPRVEAEEHPYDVDTNNFREYWPQAASDLLHEGRSIFEAMLENKDRLEAVRGMIEPKTKWRRKP